MGSQGKTRYFSLKRRFLILAASYALMSVLTIVAIFFVSNRAFNGLVDISAKNLTMLYETSDLKTLLSNELLAWNSYTRTAITFENLGTYITRTHSTAVDLRSNVTEQLKPLVSDFIDFHREMVNQILDLKTEQEESPTQEISLEQRKKIFKNQEKISALYKKSYEKLGKISDAVSIGTGEQQAHAIKISNQILTLTLLAVTVTMLGIISLLHAYLNKSIIGPIMQISKASQRASRGYLVRLPQIGRRNEISVLFENYNHMLGEIESNITNKEALLQEAERANQAKSVFLANMSHELRTPMHGILSFARFGQQRIELLPKEKIKSYFEEIHESGTRLLVLLNDLLELSKLEAGKISYSIKDSNLTDIVTVIASEMRAYAEEKKVKIQILELPEKVMGLFDEVKIQQVIRNLVGNAIKFSSPNTAIGIELEDDGEIARCRVINHGLGIPEGELQAVFDKFVQSSKTRSSAGGTGLGLAICKEIVEQHGGKIWAENGAEGETIFSFELPKAPSVSVAKAA